MCNPVCTGGYHAELHTDAVVKQCEIVDVIEIIGSKKMTPYERPLYLKNGDVVLCRIRVNNSIRVENFSVDHHLGRFTIHSAGKTTALGILVELPPVGRLAFPYPENYYHGTRP
ncbi:eukaryotic peptide chain release factor GTP-binding subunit-like isoform X3 [Dioscorea cayenensis subsp. rotundata]|nr:eukaryotic peptide chain release factor GTP-binding subunit-like isoform X3 [Dioscorea cayenensis subsp. rotundata]